MSKKLFFSAIFLLVSHLAQAGVIGYNGYSRNDSGNVVSNGKLEWLKWDVTLGMSVDSALTTYGADGWRIASNKDMASLFNNFNFVQFTSWTDVENETQANPSAWTPSDAGPHSLFIELFGSTYHSQCAPDQTVWCYSRSEPYKFTFATYVSDANGNGLLNSAIIADDFIYLTPYDESYDFNVALLCADSPEACNAYHQYDRGIALVRDVPEPGTLSLLALILFGLVASRRITARQSYTNTK
jgi:hypothetical protein